MRNAAWVLVLVAALPLCAADDAVKSAYAMATKDNACYGVELLETLCESFHKSGTADQYVNGIARTLKVSQRSANAIALASFPMIAETFSTDIEPEERARLRDLLNDALEHEQNRAPVIGMLAMIAAYDEDGAGYRALAPMVGNDTAAAIAAARATSGQASVAFLGPALEKDPDNVELIDAIGSLTYDNQVRAAFGPIRITNEGVTLRASSSADRFSEQLSAIADSSTPGMLLAAFDVVPADLQKQILAETDGRELALDLAAAALLEKKPLVARFFDGGLKAASPPKAASTPEGDDESVMRRLLAASMPDAKDDPFDVILNSLNLAGGVRGEFFATFAEQRGYASLAAEIREDDHIRRMADANDDKVPASWRAVMAPLKRPDAIDDTMTRIASAKALAAPRIVPFTEHRLEEIQSKSTVAQVIDCTDAERVARTTHLPNYVSPLRMERDGNDVVAVVISSALDPIGEIGLGAYWVLRSQDGGNTWSRYYTGLRENQPYVMSRVSTLPLLDGDRLRIEVEVKELDMASITFPPVAMRIARSESGLYLDMPWSELARDSDADGLTDLYEERITTDPHEIDSDHDGIADAEDLLPRVARTTGRTPTAEILAAVLEGFSLGGGRLVVGIGDAAAAEVAQQSCEVRTSDTGDPVLFLVGDPAAFAPLTLTRRTIILTDDEDAAYNVKFGPTFAARIRHFVVEKNGRRAIIELNQSWTGATYLLEKTSEGWRVTPISQWIT